jgi:hypothetical protein
MRRLIAVVVVVLVGVAIAAPTAWAGSPHFVSNTVEATRTDNSVTVAGKEAGLGGEEQVSILLTGTAECINKGAKHPKAANKESVAEKGTFPVQNGKAEFELTLTASFSPECAPPMTVVFSNVTVSDTTNGISKNLGSF